MIWNIRKHQFLSLKIKKTVDKLFCRDDFVMNQK